MSVVIDNAELAYNKKWIWSNRCQELAVNYLILKRLIFSGSIIDYIDRYLYGGFSGTNQSHSKLWLSENKYFRNHSFVVFSLLIKW